MVKAVIYDVDGTMVDSEPLHVQAWDDTLRQYAHKLSDLSEEFRSTMAGKKPIVIAGGMVDELGLEITPEALLQTKASIFMRLVETDLKGMLGVVESIKRFKAAGLRLAIGTSLHAEYIRLVLERLGVQTAFEIIVTGDEIKNGKPHPETYLTVAEKLELEPSECVVLEDAKSGIESATAAGCCCIAIENPNALPQDTSSADVVVGTLDEVTEKLLRELVA
jgi:beta-phosphoglucomutase-like phosphatase (HAD superfamily)